MAFHFMTTSSNCAISRTEYSFLSQQSVMSAPAIQSVSCPQTGYLNWFGTAKVTKQGPLATASLRTRKVLKTSQGCHTCNRTAPHPVVKRPAVRSRQVPLMKRFSEWARENSVPIIVFSLKEEKIVNIVKGRGTYTIVSDYK